MDMNENFGSKIKKLRMGLGLTQSQVAEAMNVTPGYISNVENNRTGMSLRLLIFFSKVTGKSLDSLVGLLEEDYLPTSLDHELQDKLSRVDDDTKRKLLATLDIWMEN